MSARAQAAAETGERILDAMHALFGEHPYDRITLAMVAGRAGVTLQTVLRRYGSKDGLLAAAATEGNARILAQRSEAPVDDVPGAVRNLFDHYEAWGQTALLLLEQEQRIPAIAALTREGRSTHTEWIERVFATVLRARRGRAREIMLSQLIVLTDVYVWKILRHDRGLPRKAAEQAVIELVQLIEGGK